MLRLSHVLLPVDIKKALKNKYKAEIIMGIVFIRFLDCHQSYTVMSCKLSHRQSRHLKARQEYMTFSYVQVYCRNEVMMKTRLVREAKVNLLCTLS